MKPFLVLNWEKKKNSSTLCSFLVDIHRRNDQLFVSAHFDNLILQMDCYISKQAKFFFDIVKPVWNQTMTFVMEQG